MNMALQKLLLFMLSKKYIGARHIPEEWLIKLKTSFNNVKERKEFNNEYKEMINNEFILRLKKRTGRGSEWHISLNPRIVNNLREILNKVDEESGMND